MSKLTFIFLCTIYVLLSITSFAGEISIESEILFCGLAILFVGIPHGAIDHILFLDGSDIKEGDFYIAYISVMLLYGTVWFFTPVFAISIFLLVSAYHFGESQLTDFFPTKSVFRYIVFTVWGIHILSSLIYFNHVELALLSESYLDLKPLSVVSDGDIAQSFLWITSLSIALLVAYVIYYRLLKIEELMKEILTIVLIHLAFFLFPLLLGFTVYFVILHSFKVLIDEFNFLSKKNLQLSLKSFVIKLLPLTCISLLGSALLVLLIQFELISISYVLLAIVLISLITLPHSIVMNKFYNRN